VGPPGSTSQLVHQTSRAQGAAKNRLGGSLAASGAAPLAAAWPDGADARSAGPFVCRDRPARCRFGV